MVGQELTSVATIRSWNLVLRAMLAIEKKQVTRISGDSRSKRDRFHAMALRDHRYASCNAISSVTRPCFVVIPKGSPRMQSRGASLPMEVIQCVVFPFC